MTDRPYFWTTQEIALLREHYPQGGINACLPHINRTRSSIYQHAHAQGLRAPSAPGVRLHHEVTSELDAAIRLLHQRPLLRGAIIEFAARWGRPAWWVSKRARELGLKTPRFREPPWTLAEVEILHDTAHFTPAIASARLRKAGYRRSESAVIVKRKRECIGVTQSRVDAGYMSGSYLAELLGLDRKTPATWVARHGLKGARRWKDGRENDEIVIREKDFREFVITNPARIELRKIPDSSRAWFIELLAGRAGEAVEKVA